MHKHKKYFDADTCFCLLLCSVKIKRPLPLWNCLYAYLRAHLFATAHWNILLTLVFATAHSFAMTVKFAYSANFNHNCNLLKGWGYLASLLFHHNLFLDGKTECVNRVEFNCLVTLSIKCKSSFPEKSIPKHPCGNLRYKYCNIELIASLH